MKSLETMEIGTVKTMIATSSLTCEELPDSVHSPVYTATLLFIQALITSPPHRGFPRFFFWPPSQPFFSKHFHALANETTCPDLLAFLWPSRLPGDVTMQILVWEKNLGGVPKFLLRELGLNTRVL